MLQVKRNNLHGKKLSVSDLCKMLRYRPEAAKTPSKIQPPGKPRKTNGFDRESQLDHEQSKENINMNTQHHRSSSRIGKTPVTQQPDRLSRNQFSYCQNHPSKKAIFQYRQQDEFCHVCDKCAIQLTSEGKRLIMITNPEKKQLMDCMRQQLEAVRQSYSTLIDRLWSELSTLEDTIRKSYENLVQNYEQTPLKILYFKPEPISSEILQKINDFVGTVQEKPFNKQILLDIDKSVDDQQVRPFSYRSHSNLMERPKHRHKFQGVLQHQIENFINNV